MINVISSSRYKINRKAIKKQASLILEKNNCQDRILNIVFVGKNKMRSISSNYKNEPVALPVLSFPYKESVDGDNFLGEVILCFPQVVLLAAERNKKVDDMTAQLIEHGIKNLLSN